MLPTFGPAFPVGPLGPLSPRGPLRPKNEHLFRISKCLMDDFCLAVLVKVHFSNKCAIIVLRRGLLRKTNRWSSLSTWAWLSCCALETQIAHITKKQYHVDGFTL